MKPDDVRPAPAYQPPPDLHEGPFRDSIVDWANCRPLRHRGLLAVGITDAGPGFRYGARRNNVPVLTICVGGRAEAWTAEGWAPMPPDTAYIAPAGVGYAVGSAAGCPCRTVWAVFAVDHPRGVRGGDQPHLEPTEGWGLEHAVAGLYREIVSAHHADALIHYAGLIDLHARRALGEGASRLAALWRRVDADLAYPWTLERLAREAGMSLEQLRQRCLAETGMSPMRRVTSIRLERGASLLTRRALTVEAIAWAVGYTSAFAFSTAFRRQFGVSPSEFRRRGEDLEREGEGGLRESEGR